MFKLNNHILEIKYKLIYVSISLFLTILTCYMYSYEIIELLSEPLKYLENYNENITLYYARIFEIFQIYASIYF